jgi:hypothetical protein
VEIPTAILEEKPLLVFSFCNIVSQSSLLSRQLHTLFVGTCFLHFNFFSLSIDLGLFVNLRKMAQFL